MLQGLILGLEGRPVGQILRVEPRHDVVYLPPVSDVVEQHGAPHTHIHIIGVGQREGGRGQLGKVQFGDHVHSSFLFYGLWPV